MNSYNNRDNMDVDMTADFSNGPNSQPLTLNPRMFETATHQNSESAHGMDYQETDESGNLPPYATVPDVSQNAFPAPIINEPSTEPGHDESQNDACADLQTAIEHAMEIDQKPVTNEAEEWTTLTDFDTSNFTQNPITSLPPFQALYNAYIASYTDVNATNATRMTHAKAFAFALLKHYYPTSQNYTVEPTSHGPIAKHGMSFILEADDGSDIWRDPPTKPPVKKSKKKGGSTKHQREMAAAKARTEEYFHGLNYTNGLSWDWIEPQDIAGFVVHRTVKVTDEKTGVVTEETRLYTYLAIMIDSFDELPRFSTANIMHRSDILADVLCRNAELREGYGILFFGPRIEFYAFQAGTEWVDGASDGDVQNGALDGFDEAQDVEPIMRSLISEDGEQDRVIDVRTMGLDAVDQAMKSVVQLQVEWMDGTIVESNGDAGEGASGEFGKEGYDLMESAEVGDGMVKEET